MSGWYYSKKGERVGPVSVDELKALIEQSVVNSKDLVWKTGMDEWVPADSVGELSEAFPPPLPSQLNERGKENEMPYEPNEQSNPFDWGNWDLGGRIIFVSACVALFTMLMKWVDIGFASANGFSQGAFLFLGVYVYPVLMLMQKKSIHLAWGSACGGLGILLAIIYISSRSVEILGRSVNLAATGPYLFLLACIALIVGVTQYRKGP